MSVNELTPFCDGPLGLTRSDCENNHHTTTAAGGVAPPRQEKVFILAILAATNAWWVLGLVNLAFDDRTPLAVVVKTIPKPVTILGVWRTKGTTRRVKVGIARPSNSRYRRKASTIAATAA